MIDLLLIKQIFANSYTEINKNHDEAINVFRNYYRKLNKKPSILVNFDTHSDVYTNTDVEVCNIANWVNYAVCEFGINELYWVIPNYIAKNKRFREVYEKEKLLSLNNCMLGFDDKACDLNIVNETEFYVRAEKQELISAKKISHINNKCKQFGIEPIVVPGKEIKHLKVYILTSENLSVLKDKDFLLSIDSDYFCNSGFDTSERVGNPEISCEDLRNEINYFLKKMKEAQIYPICTSLTLSPVYLPSKFSDEIQNFYSEIKKSSSN